MRTYSTDVVVISAGTAGLAATVSAAEQGLKVITVERNGSAGGNGNLGNGPFAVESRLQRERMYTLTKEEAYRQHMEFTQWNVNGRLVKQYIDRSADTIRWLEEMGVEFEGLGCHGIGMNYTWHLIKPLPGTEDKPMNGGYIIVRTLKAKAEQLGAQFLMKTSAKKLLKEDGKIVGLIAEDAEGEIEIRSKAVISCAGGYGAYWRAPMGVPLFGDGLNMAREVGAEVTDGTMPVPKKEAMGGGAFKPPFGTMCIKNMGGQPNLIVNKLGERFVDEERFYVDCHGCNALASQPDRVAFNIFSDDIVAHYMEYGFDFIEGFGIRKMGDKPMSKPERFYNELKDALAKGDPSVRCADTVEDLAAQIDVPADALKATLEEYNLACETGRDTALGKRAEYLRPIHGKLYAVSTRTIMGDGYPEGISINHRFEVVTPEKAPIPGYYAAGMDTARSIWSDIYVNILPGNAYGWALNSGRMSAEYATKYIRSMEG